MLNYVHIQNIYDLFFKIKRKGSNIVEKFFKLKEHNTDVKTEILAGITTFMAMAYILIVNPNILSDAGMDKGAVFTATAISAAIATIAMAFLANYPVALASGMGLNAFFAYTVASQYGWQIALTIITSLLVLGIITTFWADEPKGIKKPTTFKESFIEPFRDLLKREKSIILLLFINQTGNRYIQKGFFDNRKMPLLTLAN